MDSIPSMFSVHQFDFDVYARSLKTGGVDNAKPQMFLCYLCFCVIHIIPKTNIGIISETC